MNPARITELAKSQGKTIIHLCSLIGKNRNFFVDVQKKDLAVPLESLQIIADDLGTTVEYLTWQTDNPLPAENKNSVSEKLKTVLSEEERGLIDDFRTLNKQGREWIRQSMTAAVTLYGSDSAPADAAEAKK